MGKSSDETAKYNKVFFLIGGIEFLIKPNRSIYRPVHNVANGGKTYKNIKARLARRTKEGRLEHVARN